MVLSSAIADDLLHFVSPLYAHKDTMHDLSHIERVRRRALELSRGRACDEQLLSLAVCLHGVIYSHEREIRALLAEYDVSEDDVERLVAVAWESQKESPPETMEGMILHDAHLLEGDENFLITKTLVTGSARGQSLAQTVAYFDAHVGQHRCCLPENQRELERREAIAREYMGKLRAEI
jgi:uncharacterized protein